MANGRYKGATPEERLAVNTLLDGDMIQVRHRIGQDGDSDKGVSKAVLQGIPLAVCENLPTVATKYAVLQNCPDFTLVAGRSVLVYFRYGNTAENATLNVAGTGDIPMDSTVGLPSWKAETWQMFTYATATVNGVLKNNWVLIQGAIEREVKNITSYLLDGSFFPRILGSGYETMAGIESDDYFYCLGYYDNKENIKWKVKEDNGKIFIKSNFGFYPFVSHHYYRAKFDDMLDYNYDNVPLVCLYPQIFTKQTALSLGINPYEDGELKLFKFFEDSGLIVVKIGDEYAKSTDGVTWTKINGPQDDDVTCIFYNSSNGNIYFKGKYYTSCGVTNSSGTFTPEPTPSPSQQYEMSQWINVNVGITSTGYIGYYGTSATHQVPDYVNGTPIKATPVAAGSLDYWVAYPVDDNGNVYLKLFRSAGIEVNNVKTVTFQLDEEDIECSKVLVDYYNNTLYICAVYTDSATNYLLFGTLPASELTNSEITVQLKRVYDYEQKVNEDMTMRVNPSKMSFSMIGNKPFLCTAKKGTTNLERFVIFEDTSDHKLLACSCGFVDFDYDDNWNNRYEYDSINMLLYRMCPCLDYLDYSNYIREHKYDEFTEQKSEVIPISPPEEQYASAGDDCDCYVRLA